MTQHWKLTLSYDGSAFHGWQIQPGLATVQGTLAIAIRRVAGEEVLPQGSGRTDAGVHALAQVASFSTDALIPPPNFLCALNRILPSSIRVLSAEPVDGSFHARHSARAKTYEYRIFQRRVLLPDGTCAEQICSPFTAPFVWDCRWPLQLERMQAAAQVICGTHDFTSFAAVNPERSARAEDVPETGKPNPVKTIMQSQWFPDGELLIYKVRGSGFLHHMVRNLVGTFVDVGRGSLEPEYIAHILEARNRSAAGATAPASGLFLKHVEYDENHGQTASHK